MEYSTKSSDCVPPQLERVADSTISPVANSGFDINLSQERYVLLELLAKRMIKLMPHTERISLLDNKIMLTRFNSEKSGPYSSLTHPMVVLTVQGTKVSKMGVNSMEYGAGELFLIGLDMPTLIHISRVNSEFPSLSIIIALDPVLLQEVLIQLPDLEAQELLYSNMCASHMPASESVLLSFLKLLEMYDQGITHDYPYTLVLMEIYYAILISPLGLELRKIYTSGSQNHKIAKAINIMNNNYRSDVGIDELAGMVGMTVPTFYKHFKQVTSLSPLQYLKRLRLYEAKRLMTVQNMTAAAAGYEVGYASEQHFSRDYKKLFGRPPMQDVRECPFVLELAPRFKS